MKTDLLLMKTNEVERAVIINLKAEIQVQTQGLQDQTGAGKDKKSLNIKANKAVNQNDSFIC